MDFQLLYCIKYVICPKPHPNLRYFHASYTFPRRNKPEIYKIHNLHRLEQYPQKAKITPYNKVENWRNLYFFARLRQDINYFEASAMSAARSSSLMFFSISSSFSFCSAAFSSLFSSSSSITLSKYELYSNFFFKGYGPMYFEVMSPLSLCPMPPCMYLSGTLPVLVKLVAKL